MPGADGRANLAVTHTLPMAAMSVVLAHGSGIDDALFVLVPLGLFALLLLVARRRAAEELAAEGDSSSAPPDDVPGNP